jgi:hypothetical protein
MTPGSNIIRRITKLKLIIIKRVTERLKPDFKVQEEGGGGGGGGGE